MILKQYLVAMLDENPTLYLCWAQYGSSSYQLTKNIKDAIRAHSKALIEDHLDIYLIDMVEDSPELYTVIEEEYIMI